MVRISYTLVGIVARSKFHSFHPGEHGPSSLLLSSGPRLRASPFVFGWNDRANWRRRRHDQRELTRCRSLQPQVPHSAFTKPTVVSDRPIKCHQGSKTNKSEFSFLEKLMFSWFRKDFCRYAFDPGYGRRRCSEIFHTVETGPNHLPVRANVWATKQSSIFLPVW